MVALHYGHANATRVAAERGDHAKKRLPHRPMGTACGAYHRKYLKACCHRRPT